MVEFTLSQLFSTFMNRHATGAVSFHSYPALEAYAAIIGFKTRTSVLRKAAGVFFRLNGFDDLQPPFKSAVDRADNFSPRRNDIAHGIVLRREENDKNLRFFLETSFESRGTGHKATYSLTSREVGYFTDRFVECQDELQELVYTIRARCRASPPKYE
ncbi:hypothetical protein GCM10007036_14320 [Alsobacter metallidurans]|uniref:Uncharacterized protein n=2 Tax=Alsobacter metallidurans TaxID=340221 RepID=A0A917MJ22_9HYPH|nr:hypothetical protein GCM10007036_14320 [Alsobacter metallidurans]